MKDAVNFHKEIMESLAKNTQKYTADKVFDIFSISLAVTISNVMGTFGVKNIDCFLHHMIIIIKQIHEDVQKNSSYMEFKDGKKISEGRFN